jgi:MoxR-like ATPase
MDLLLSSQTPVLLTGVPGVGKSSLVQVCCQLFLFTTAYISSCSQHLVQGRHSYNRISISRSLSPTVFQSMISHCLPDARSKLLDAKSKGKPHTLFFIEDMNTARADESTGEKNILYFCSILMFC